jgi:hypothetical protein
VLTDGKGEYEIDGLSGSATYKIRAEKWNYYTFESPSIPAVDGSRIQVSFALDSLVPRELAFVVFPTGAFLGSVLTPGVRVIVVDSARNVPSASYNATVTVSLVGSPPGAILAGTKTLVTSSGAAEFKDLSINLSGTYALSASSPGLTSATSAPIVIGSGPSQAVLLSVSSRLPWQDTGINLQVGDRITITASGVIQFATDGSSSTPDGITATANTNSNGTCTFLLCGGAIHQNTLVARVGSNSLADFTTGFVVGKSLSNKVITIAGRLYLGYNDGFVLVDRSGLDIGGVGDNSGSFSASLVVVPALASGTRR